MTRNAPLQRTLVAPGRAPGGEATPIPGFSRRAPNVGALQIAPGNSGPTSAPDLARSGGREKPNAIPRGAGAAARRERRSLRPGVRA